MPTATMKLARHQIPTRFPALPNLAFSASTPSDFVTPELPCARPNFEDPTFMMPLWAASSPIALAVLAVAVRPAYDNGTLTDWLTYLAGEQGLALTNLRTAKLGSHPALLASAEQVQEGTALNLRLAAFEDGGYLFIITAMCPAELWPSFGPVLEAAVESIQLTEPLGATRPMA